MFYKKRYKTLEAEYNTLKSDYNKLQHSHSQLCKVMYEIHGIMTVMPFSEKVALKGKTCMRTIIENIQGYFNQLEEEKRKHAAI